MNKGLCMKRAEPTARLTTSGKEKGFNNFKKHDISLMSNDSPRKSATLRATLFDKASVNKTMRATNSI